MSGKGVELFSVHIPFEAKSRSAFPSGARLAGN